MVANEEYIADERIQSIANPNVFLRVVSLKSSLHLALCVVFGTHAVAVAPLVDEISVAHLVGMFLENAVQHPVGDERFGEKFFLPVQSVALNLLATHAERRRKLSQKSVNRMHGYLPNAEEAQDMVDAVSVEIV